MAWRAGSGLFLLVVVVGCASSHPLADGAVADGAILLCVDEDHDGDRSSACGGTDCDDHDPERRRHAPELCNLVDDDCDGVVDQLLSGCGDTANGALGCCRGGCYVFDCAEGFADCDLDATNGCETSGACDTSPIVQLVGGEAFSCARRASGRVVCWGNAQIVDRFACIEEEFTQVLAAGVAIDLSAQSRTICVVGADGRVGCWGANERGQTGSASSDAWIPPVAWIEGIDDAVRVAVGSEHACAASAHGSVRCWGANDQRQLGDGTVEASAAPRLVSGIDDAMDVAVTDVSSCVLRRSGRVSCWGAWFGPSPVDLVGLDDALDVAASANDLCVLRRNGAVACFGRSFWGEIGAPSVSTLVPLPVADIVEVAVGHGHVCVRDGTNTVFCAGWNQSGQLADGTNVDRADLREATELGRPILLGAGVYHSLGLLPDGRVIGAGSDFAGELDTHPSGDSSIATFVTTRVP